MNQLAPVILFTYNRLIETRRTVESLFVNYLAPKSDLFIFSDGPKSKSDELIIQYVRKYLKNLNGFNNIIICEQKNNKGLASSIIDGVTQVIEEYGKVIVLEDDLITSPNFLDFMNQALNSYKNSENIYSISGYSMNLPSLKNYPEDYYLGYRASSWGWGTWKDKWEMIDWEVSDYPSFKSNLSRQIKFMRGGSDLPYMLWKQMNGKIDSWAIRWCYEQFKREMHTVFPSESKIKNIGFGEDATHTKNISRFDTKLDLGIQRDFRFDPNPEVDMKLAKEFRSKFSVKNRLMERLQ